MGKVTGFLEIERRDRVYDPVAERIGHYKEFVQPLSASALKDQAARCMNCGIPYCHNGCPVNNQIPDWNDLVYRDNPRAALEVLHSTNNFPEFTGRICPAPCEASCTLNIDDNPVTIKTIECQIIDNGWEQGWVTPKLAPRPTGKRIAVVGSGPAGLACAQQLARAGHSVTVFEKNDRIGGLLRYGIPDFKLDKGLIDRRANQMRAEGVVFVTNAHIGVTQTVAALREDFDALVMAGGAEQPRGLQLPQHNLSGIHFAMDFLRQQNKRNAGDAEDRAAPGGSTISAKGKHVVVIGGGDTGSDCIGTSIRQGALSVTQLEIMPAPPERENKALTWPNWPLKMRTSSSQAEGAERDFAVTTRAALGSEGRIEALECARLEWSTGPDGRMTMAEVPGSAFQLKADLVLLAMGFLGPVREGLIQDVGVALTAQGNVAADTESYVASQPDVFACGDMRRGQSLVVWAIREGRQCARAVDLHLMGETTLPR
jgi:glutamate synthase (NADPH) small chain